MGNVRSCPAAAPPLAPSNDGFSGQQKVLMDQLVLSAAQDREIAGTLAKEVEQLKVQLEAQSRRTEELSHKLNDEQKQNTELLRKLHDTENHDQSTANFARQLTKTTAHLEAEFSHNRGTASPSSRDFEIFLFLASAVAGIEELVRRIAQLEEDLSLLLKSLPKGQEVLHKHQVEEVRAKLEHVIRLSKETVVNVAGPTLDSLTPDPLSEEQCLQVHRSSSVTHHHRHEEHPHHDGGPQASNSTSNSPRH
jgi:predicted RNase H-like nuclease (RuvC/YqgF family)